MSPFNPFIFASASEDQLKIFDKRKFKYPLLQINQDIKDFEFSVYHSYVLATIHGREESKEDSNIVKFWNINSAVIESLQSTETSATELKYPFTYKKNEDTISSICWCPKAENDVYDNKYLIVSGNGSIQEHKYKVIDTMPIAFSSSNTLAFTCDSNSDSTSNQDQTSKIFFITMNQDITKMDSKIDFHRDGGVDSGEEYATETDLDDISELITRRLSCKYGLDINHNIALSNQFANSGINVVWKWLRVVKDNFKNLNPRQNPMNDIVPFYKGIYSLLRFDWDEEIKQANDEAENKNNNDQLPGDNDHDFNDKDRNFACNIWGWTDSLFYTTNKARHDKIKEICNKIIKSTDISEQNDQEDGFGKDFLLLFYQIML